MFLSPERPNIHWNDIVGLIRAKAALKDLSQETKTVLLYGLSGCGMKMLARATATESHAEFFHVCPIRIISPRRGETQRNLQNLFEQARQYERAVIFFDELDVFFSEDQEQLSLCAAFLDLMKKAVESPNKRIIMAATGYPDLLAPEILEQFQKRIYIGLPDRRSRLQILERRLASPLNLTRKDLEDLTNQTEGNLLTCADITRICRQLIDLQTNSESGSSDASDGTGRKKFFSNDLTIAFANLVAKTEQEESQTEHRERLAVYRDWDPMSFDDFDAEFVPWSHVF